MAFTFVVVVFLGGDEDDTLKDRVLIAMRPKKLLNFAADLFRAFIAKLRNWSDEVSENREEKESKKEKEREEKLPKILGLDSKFC